MSVELTITLVSIVFIICGVYFLTQQDKIAVKAELKAWKDLANAYVESSNFYKQLAQKYFDRIFENRQQIPYYEFILGDKTTGWVWTESFEGRKPVNIGDTVTLIKPDAVSVDCIVERFGGINQFENYIPHISFYVIEKQIPENK